MVTPSGSHVKKHSLFGTTATWPSEAGAPAVIEGLGTAEAPLPRPSDAAGWLSLGWSIPFEGHAWIAAAAVGPSGDPEQITERHCYMAGLALDSQDASLWLLLAADMAAAEEALSDERRRELDDDNAPDLLWTVTVRGAGERLYADACYVRCLRVDSTSKRAAIAWAHLYRYLHRSNAIIEVGEDYVTANDCLRRCLSTDSTSACCLRALSDYLAANKLPRAACEGKSWSVADAAIGAIKSGFTTNSKIWSRLAWAIYSLHYESKFENRPLSVTLHEKEYSMVTAAASAIELDPQDEDAWFVIAMSPDAFHRLPPSHFYVAKDGRLADNLVTAAVLGVEHTVDKEGRLWYALCKAMSITKLSTVGILDRQWTFEECIHECLRREPAKIIYASTWCSHARRRSLHLEGRGPLTATELAVLAVETVPDSGEAWARLGEIMRNHERFEPGLRSVTVKGVEMTTLEVLERALTLTPDHMKAWYNYALEDSVPADVFVMPNGVIVTPVSLSAALVNMYIEEAGPWAWLGYTLLMSKQPYAVVAMREVSAFECFKQAYLRQPNFSSWRTVASMSTRDPLQFGDETLTRKECYRRSLAWDDEDALAWAELGELLTTLPYGERSVTVAEREYTAQECWLQAVNVAHPHYDAHGLAKAFFHLADDLADATDTVDVALRPYFLADDIVDPAILKQREKVTLGKEQLLQRCIAVATTHGSRADRFEMRDLLDRATKALEVLQSP